MGAPASAFPGNCLNITGFDFVTDRLGVKVYAVSTLLNGNGAASATFTRRLAFHNFNLASLSGPYILSISGRTDANLTGGEAIVSTDGRGNASATINFQADVATCIGTANGTYTVNPDGTGTFSFPDINSLCTTIIPISVFLLELRARRCSGTRPIWFLPTSRVIFSSWASCPTDSPALTHPIQGRNSFYCLCCVYSIRMISCLKLLSESACSPSILLDFSSPGVADPIFYFWRSH
jgi:hypothetical protein